MLPLYAAATPSTVLYTQRRSRGYAVELLYRYYCFSGENKKNIVFSHGTHRNKSATTTTPLARKPSKEVSPNGFGGTAHSTQHAKRSQHKRPHSPPPGSPDEPTQTADAASISKKQTTTGVRTHFQKKISISINSLCGHLPPRRDEKVPPPQAATASQRGLRTQSAQLHLSHCLVLSVPVRTLQYFRPCVGNKIMRRLQ